MKKTILFIFFALILCYNLAYTQKIKTYRAWVTLTNGDKANGALSAADEGGLVILNWETRDTVARIAGGEIKVLKFRRKGGMGRGAWIGAVSGAAVGVIIGLADGDDEAGWFAMTAEEKAVGAGIGLAIPGTFIGLIVGSVPKRMVIKGDRDTYLELLPEIKKYVLHQ